ncbi:unnamed protein product, partial [Staurois parvus]
MIQSPSRHIPCLLLENVPEFPLTPMMEHILHGRLGNVSFLLSSNVRGSMLH